jgi:CHAT domain-containing protein
MPDARVFTAGEATEAAIKRINQPRILHIASHGFFLEDKKDEKSIENPLLRSGLIFAGANKRQSGAGEDGVLTGLEAAGLNLWGTKLVVLSACDTGVGDVRNGEGVYGLRRALVLAGAESQLLSLWKVRDEPTRDLMVDFYGRLQRGEGCTDALWQAQLTMLRGARELRRHPYFWAGFIQSGDWRSINSPKLSVK